MLFEGVLLGIFGAILGSFLNVLILRLRQQVSVMGRSQCPHCRQPLRMHHLVPIISWIWLRGRCAFCRRPIHVQYPLVEMASALVFLFAYFRHPFLIQVGDWSPFLFEVLFLLVLLVLVVFDARWKLLPLELMIVGALAAAGWNVFSGSLSWQSVFVGMLVGGAFLGAQVLLSRGRAMGGGDPWLGMLMGAALGWPRVGTALYITYVVGGVVVLVLFLLGIVRKGSRIPFAPLLALGTLGAMLFGAVIERWFTILL